MFSWYKTVARAKKMLFFMKILQYCTGLKMFMFWRDEVKA